jgi:hypothetical protein
MSSPHYDFKNCQALNTRTLAMNQTSLDVLAQSLCQHNDIVKRSVEVITN